MRHNEVPQELARINAQFVEAFKAQDPAAVAGVYHETARVMPPGTEARLGRQRIEAFWREVMQSGVRAIELQTVELHVEGDSASEIGAATLFTRTPEGVETTVEAKYVVVWKRDAHDAWRWAIDIWNYNA